MIKTVIDVKRIFFFFLFFFVHRSLFPMLSHNFNLRTQIDPTFNAKQPDKSSILLDYQRNQLSFLTIIDTNQINRHTNDTSKGYMVVFFFLIDRLSFSKKKSRNDFFYVFVFHCYFRSNVLLSLSLNYPVHICKL